MKNGFKRAISIVLAISLIMLIVPASAAMAAVAEPECQIQTTEKWLDYYYGSYHLFNTGCGMFSFCNAVHFLTGNNPSVTEVSEWAHNNDWFNGSCGGGTTYNFFYNMEWKYGSRFGFSVPSDGEDGTWNSSVLMQHLANGGVAIGNVPGHFIAIVGYDYDTDMYHIYDSAPTYARGTYDGNSSNVGNIWLSRSSLNANSSNMYLRWFCRLSRTGSAPAWSTGSPSAGIAANLGDSFYAQMYNSAYNKYVTLEYDNPIAFTNVSDNSHIWKFERMGADNAYKITNAQTGLVLDLKGGDDTPGGDIITYNDVGSSAQRWYLVEVNGGYVIQCKASLSNALDIDTGGKTGIANWGENSKENQVFTLKYLTMPASGTPVGVGKSFYGQLHNTEYDKYLSLDYETYGPDNPIAFSKNDSNPSQIWKFEWNQDDGSYKLTNTRNSKVLAVEGGSSAAGADVITEADTGADNQRWYLMRVESGYKLQCKTSPANALDIDTGGKTGVGNWSAHGGVNQIFEIVTLNGGYTVKHYVQNVNGKASLKDAENYTLADSVTVGISAFGEVTPALNRYNHRVAPNAVTITPAKDGSTIIEYYYSLMYGDVNTDEAVDANDLVSLKQRLVNNGTVDSELADRLSDINGDGKVSLSDALRLKLYLADTTVKVGD